jgi:Zn-dependent protease with chaperone function
MILPYSLRLVALALAAGFLVNAGLSLAAWVASPLAIRRAGRLTARAAARLLLGLRLLPAAGALLFVAAWCVPGYFWLEQPGPERVGLACLIAAALGAAVSGAAGVRGCGALVRSARCWRGWRAAGRRVQLPGEPSPIWVIDAPGPLVALAGILRPHVVVGRTVIRALSPGDLASALRHERAHSKSRDNLKRLAVMLAPPLLPGWRGLHRIEQAWLSFSEWAADDRAAAGNGPDALSLAAALVRLARMKASPRVPALATSLLGNTGEVSARVERLLAGVAEREPQGSRAAPFGWMILAGAAALLLQPAALLWAHSLLERLAG